MIWYVLNILKISLIVWKQQERVEIQWNHYSPQEMVAAIDVPAKLFIFSTHLEYVLKHCWICGSGTLKVNWKKMNFSVIYYNIFQFSCSWPWTKSYASAPLVLQDLWTNWITTTDFSGFSRYRQQLSIHLASIILDKTSSFFRERETVRDTEMKREQRESSVCRGPWRIPVPKPASSSSFMREKRVQVKVTQRAIMLRVGLIGIIRKELQKVIREMDGKPGEYDVIIIAILSTSLSSYSMSLHASADLFLN